MKKVINGKKYDTSTAASLAYYSNGEHGLYEVYEVLYRKATGEFFLHHGHGGLACFVWPCHPRGRKDLQCITPMTESEARRWCEERCDGDTYERIFGLVTE